MSKKREKLKDRIKSVEHQATHPFETLKNVASNAAADAKAALKTIDSDAKIVGKDAKDAAKWAAIAPILAPAKPFEGLMRKGLEKKGVTKASDKKTKLPQILGLFLKHNIAGVPVVNGNLENYHLENLENLFGFQSIPHPLGKQYINKDGSIVYVNNKSGVTTHISGLDGSVTYIKTGSIPNEKTSTSQSLEFYAELENAELSTDELAIISQAIADAASSSSDSSSGGGSGSGGGSDSNQPYTPYITPALIPATPIAAATAVQSAVSIPKIKPTLGNSVPVHIFPAISHASNSNTSRKRHLENIDASDIGKAAKDVGAGISAAKSGNANVEATAFAAADLLAQNSGIPGADEIVKIIHAVIDHITGMSKKAKGQVLTPDEAKALGNTPVDKDLVAQADLIQDEAVANGVGNVKSTDKVDLNGKVHVPLLERLFPKWYERTHSIKK